ncbi:MAG: mandelate racemase/muconate lactonizing enzyme family protein [Dethiobacteria bacterium]|nr:mandelate racemase/muconate lactonizing enzyme family protein [Bacillota bacterium]
MKIKRIETLPLTAKMEVPLKIATTVFTSSSALLVRVITDEGLVGVGEALVRTGPKATKHIVDDLLAPRLLGKDPLDIAGLWWEMFSAMRTRGHTKGHFIEAISAVDVALWDIAGKAKGLPVYKALHGFGRQTLPAYASSIFMGSVREMEAQTQRFLDLGYKAMKIKIGMGIDRDVEAVRSIRSLVGGEIKLMVDANSVYDAATAVRLGRKLEKYDLEWFEEPVPPYDLQGYRKVKYGQAIPIAGGEGEFALYGFRDLLDTGAIDILQPDLGRVGGFTEAMRISALLQAHNLLFTPHTGMCSGVNIVAAMHFAAAAPQFYMFEFMEIEHPLLEIFTTPLPRPSVGEINMPDLPGLGVELDMSKIERYVER